VCAAFLVLLAVLVRLLPAPRPAYAGG